LFTRTTGLVIVPVWLMAMTWLVAHDVWPELTAHEPPPLEITDWLKAHGDRAQYAILARDGSQIGTSWTRYLIDEGVSTTRSDYLLLRRFVLPIAPLTIDATSVYTATGLLDEFTVRVVNGGGDLTLHGERFHSDFSFTFDGHVGHRSIQSRFKLPLNEAGLLSGAFKPFAQMSNLSVGQTWRMQVFNPVAVITGVGDKFIPMLVRVVDRQRRITRSGPRDCFVVESGRARGFVDERGVVWEQEVELPVAGTLKIVREAEYDEDAYIDAKQHTEYRRSRVRDARG